MLCLLLQQNCTQSALVSAAEQTRPFDSVLLQNAKELKHLWPFRGLSAVVAVLNSVDEQICIYISWQLPCSTTMCGQYGCKIQLLSQATQLWQFATEPELQFQITRNDGSMVITMT